MSAAEIAELTEELTECRAEAASLTAAEEECQSALQESLAEVASLTAAKEECQSALEECRAALTAKTLECSLEKAAFKASLGQLEREREDKKAESSKLKGAY